MLQAKILYLGVIVSLFIQCFFREIFELFLNHQEIFCETNLNSPLSVFVVPSFPPTIFSLLLLLILVIFIMI